MVFLKLDGINKKRKISQMKKESSKALYPRKIFLSFAIKDTLNNQVKAYGEDKPGKIALLLVKRFSWKRNYSQIRDA